MNSDGDWQATLDRTARLVAVLCIKLRWDISAVKQHHDYPRSDEKKKNCLSELRKNGGTGWRFFIGLVDHYIRNTHYLMDFRDNKSPDYDHGKIIIPNELLDLGFVDC